MRRGWRRTRGPLRCGWSASTRSGRAGGRSPGRGAQGWWGEAADGWGPGCSPLGAGHEVDRDVEDLLAVLIGEAARGDADGPAVLRRTHPLDPHRAGEGVAGADGSQEPHGAQLLACDDVEAGQHGPEAEL